MNKCSEAYCGNNSTVCICVLIGNRILLASLVMNSDNYSTVDIFHVYSHIPLKEPLYVTIILLLG